MGGLRAAWIPILVGSAGIIGFIALLSSVPCLVLFEDIRNETANTTLSFSIQIRNTAGSFLGPIQFFLNNPRAAVQYLGNVSCTTQTEKGPQDCESPVLLPKLAAQEYSPKLVYEITPTDSASNTSFSFSVIAEGAVIPILGYEVWQIKQEKLFRCQYSPEPMIRCREVAR
jgi:hypothetical protein